MSSHGSSTNEGLHVQLLAPISRKDDGPGVQEFCQRMKSFLASIAELSRREWRSGGCCGGTPEVLAGDRGRVEHILKGRCGDRILSQ